MEDLITIVVLLLITGCGLRYRHQLAVWTGLVSSLEADKERRKVLLRREIEDLSAELKEAEKEE